MTRAILLAVLALAAAPAAATAATTLPNPSLVHTDAGWAYPTQRPVTDPMVLEAAQVAKQFWLDHPGYAAEYGGDLSRLAGWQLWLATTPWYADAMTWDEQTWLNDGPGYSYDLASHHRTNAYMVATVCTALAHELGHVIGMRFPDNPGDPYHSPDPKSIMFRYEPEHNVWACHVWAAHYSAQARIAYRALRHAQGRP